MEVQEQEATKTEATEDDDTWLYGGQDGHRAQSESTSDRDAVIAQSKLSADAAVFEPKPRAERVDSTSVAVTDNHSADEATAEVTSGGGNTAVVVVTAGKDQDGNNDDGNDDEDSEDEDDDDIQVTIGDIKTSYDPNASKFKSPYQRSASQGGSAAGTKAPTKGVDLDAVGSINNVPVYEFDLDSLKVEEKPWRKPGADITDYFNYGFNEDTWTKYCEKQRRLRMENNVTKPGSNLIFVQGSHGPVHRVERPQSSDTPTGLGHSNNSYNDIPTRCGGPSPQHPKMSGTIDVIGSSVPVRDTRRTQPTDFRDHDQPQQDFHQQHISSVTSIISVPMTMPPPPHLSMPPPDFAIPPPGSMPLPHSSMPPHHLGPPPPGMIPPQMMVGPPPGYPPPQMVRVPVDQFGRPVGPPPPERRPPPGFVEHPPFGFDAFGRPLFAPPTNIPPPIWDARPNDNFGGGGAPGGISVIGGGGVGGPGRMGASPSRSDSFTSSDDEQDQKPHVKMEPLDSFNSRERDDFRLMGDRSRVRDMRRSKDYDREVDRRDYDRERDRDRSTSIRDRGRDYDADRNVRERSRERNRSRRRSREDSKRHSKRKDDDDDSHRRTKHKKSSKKIKDEPLDDMDGGSSREASASAK